MDKCCRDCPVKQAPGANEYVFHASVAKPDGEVIEVGATLSAELVDAAGGAFVSALLERMLVTVGQKMGSK